MEEKNKSVKNVKVNQENVKKNFQYKLKRAVAIVGTVIVIGSGIGIHFSGEKKDKENVNSYLSGISVSESISEYEQLKQIKIEDIKDWLEISEDSIKYEDEVVKVIKDNIDYELDELPTGSLEEYESAVKKFNDIKAKPSTVKEKEEKLKSAITIAKCAQDANEKLRKYGYKFVKEKTLRLLKEDFCKHVGIKFDDPDKIKIEIVEDELMTPYISVKDKTNENIYECNGYPYDIAQIIAAVQRAKEGESKESDVFECNVDRNVVLRDGLKAFKFLSSGATDEINWNIKVPEEDDSKYYNPIECKAPSLNKIITSPKEANLTEGRSR